MKYVILIYGNPESRAIWDNLPAEERARGLEDYQRLDEDLADSGELVVSEALADHAQTKRLVVRDGQKTTTDGPFAEAKELLAGFYLVDVENIDRAVEIAWRVPEARLGLVEVRPVMTLGDFLQ
ncbi:YciI family protein [Saccharothrix sp. NPDC042600]|uniref:YciI family protein n=1 Tax=Saccharothrix TaxID=2071 RepID=UPI0033C78E06|nr:YciI family protein [Saccharothrix mutabilis subsp. capreolus]